MSRPKVLMCIDWYLPGYRAGGPIRSCANMVAHLGQDIDFYILCSDRDYQTEHAYPTIQTGEWVKGAFNEQVMYMEPAKVNAGFIQKLILTGQFDKVYIHGMFSPRFSIAALRACKKMAVPTVLAPRGMLRSSAMAIKGAKKRIFLSMAKTRGWYRGLQFHATDKQEALDIKQWIGKQAEISIAPNLPRTIVSEAKRVSKKAGKLKLIFAGRIAEEKNLDYALKVLSGIAHARIQLDVYGAVYDTNYFKQCKQLQAQLASHISVNFYEPVPSDEVFNLLSGYHALFLPTKGENFGHVILESLMAGRPVLISDQTPWTDLEAAGCGFDLPLSSPEAFVEKMEAWAKLDEEQFQSIALKSYEKAKQFCEDPKLIAASKALFLPT